MKCCCVTSSVALALKRLCSERHCALGRVSVMVYAARRHRSNSLSNRQIFRKLCETYLSLHLFLLFIRFSIYFVSHLVVRHRIVLFNLKKI